MKITTILLLLIASCAHQSPVARCILPPRLDIGGGGPRLHKCEQASNWNICSYLTIPSDLGHDYYYFDLFGQTPICHGEWKALRKYRWRPGQRPILIWRSEEDPLPASLPRKPESFGI